MQKLKCESKQQVKQQNKKVCNPLLWFLFLSQKIRPNSHNWVTKLLGRPRQCIHKFKTTKKYKKLEEEVFKPHLNSYLKGELSIEQTSNPAQKYMIQYLIEMAQNTNNKTSFEEFLIKLNFLINDLQKWNVQIYEQQEQDIKNIKEYFDQEQQEYEDQESFEVKQENMEYQFMNQHNQVQINGNYNEKEKVNLKKHKKTIQFSKFKDMKPQFLTDALIFTIDIANLMVQKLEKVKKNHQKGGYDKNQIYQIYQIVKDLAVSETNVFELTNKIEKNSKQNEK